MKQFIHIHYVLILFLLLFSACSTQVSPHPIAAIDPTEQAGTEQAQQDEDPEDKQNDSEHVHLDGQTIIVYLLGDLSSPQAWLTTPAIRGAQDAASRLNKEGGILGAEIDLQLIDTGGLQEQTLAAFAEIADEAALVLLVSTSDAETLAPLASEAQLPVLLLSGSVPFFDQEDGEVAYVFSLAAPSNIQFEFFLDFLVKEWKKIRPQGAAEEIKLAYISWGDEFGQAALTEASLAYADRLGVEIVHQDTFNASYAEDTVNQLLAARKNGANVIYTNTYLHGPAILMNDLRLIGLAEEFIVAGPSMAMDSGTYGYLEYPENLNAFYAPFTMNWWSDQENPAIRSALQDWEVNQRSLAERCQGYLLGQAGMDIARHVLEQTVDKVGLDDLSAKAVFTSLSHLKDYRVMDGLMLVDFSEGQRHLHNLQIRQVQGFMEFVMLQDFSPVP